MTQNQMDKGRVLVNVINSLIAKIGRIELMEKEEEVSIMHLGSQIATEVKIRGDLKMIIMNELRIQAKKELDKINKEFDNL